MQEAQIGRAGPGATGLPSLLEAVTQRHVEGLARDGFRHKRDQALIGADGGTVADARQYPRHHPACRRGGQGLFLRLPVADNTVGLEQRIPSAESDACDIVRGGGTDLADEPGGTGQPGPVHDAARGRGPGDAVRQRRDGRGRGRQLQPGTVAARGQQDRPCGRTADGHP